MLFSSFRQRAHAKRGFTLIELAIVLGVSSVLFAGLWRLMSGGNTQIRDQATADQARQLAQGVRNYLATTQEGIDVVAQMNGADSSVGEKKDFSLNCTTGSTLCSFLPGNTAWDTVTNAYGQYYKVLIWRNDGVTASASSPAPATSYMVIVYTTGGEQIADTSGGRISSLLGEEGGFVYSVDTCGTAGLYAQTACGAYGGWSADLIGSYGLTAATNPGVGHIVMRMSYVAGVDTSRWLARRLYDPASEFNTMHTPLYFESGLSTPADVYLGGNTIYGASDTTTHAGYISNLRQLHLEQEYDSSTNASSENTLLINGCRSHDPTTYASLGGCLSPPVQINGDVNIIGGLHASNLNSIMYLYDSSDERLKTDVKPLEGALDKLGKIRAVSFEFKGSDRRKFGVIAQEVQKVYPNLVVPMDKTYLGVDYMGMIGPLLGAVHELKADNDALRSQLAEQARAIESLRKAIAAKKK